MTLRIVHDCDVEILGLSHENIQKALLRRTLLFGIFAALSLILIAATTHQIPSLVLCVGIAVAPVVASWLYARQFAILAQQSRSDMNMAVAVLLDLVNVLLAGGAGVETALLTAASSGDGPSFDLIRECLTRAQKSRAPYWSALQQLGDQCDVHSVRSVAQSLRIATQHGGRIRQSLTSRADALRTSNLAHIEYEAERRTERMGIPMVVMFVSFVVFIGYPAFASTMTSL